MIDEAGRERILADVVGEDQRGGFVGRVCRVRMLTTRKHAYQNGATIN